MRRWTILLVVAAALALATPALAAAPNYILVSGPGLAQTVLLGDWNENLDLLVAVANGPRAKGSAVRELARRPHYDLAEFWGWSGLPAPTSPRDANQHGTFYPAHRALRPVFVLMVDGSRVPRLASQAALRILARHGVPTRR